jgi:hypothetical protein
MFQETDTPEAPWHLVDANDQKRARLNCMTHFLDQFDYNDAQPPEVELPHLQKAEGFSDEDSLAKRNFVPTRF